MLVAIGLLVLAGDTVSGRLTGENVCQEEKRYTINVTEYFIRNSTIRNYEWCMNLPPRCSFYTTRLINDSRVVEKEVTDIIETCCSGYVEDNNRCEPVCLNCYNGSCVEGKCLCFPGYTGDECDQECSSEEWGENCKFRCECVERCHPETGECICEGIPCSNETTTETPPTKSHTKKPILYITKAARTKTISFKNNGKLEIPLVTTPVVPTTQIEDLYGEEVSSPSAPITKSKGKVNRKEVSGADADVGNYLKDDVRRGNPDPIGNNLVSSASAATAISAGIIIVAVVIVATNHFKKKARGGEETERNKGVSTVAVYTHSIFHTPLPEPPPFETPLFAAPVETATSEGRFETRVVCSMNFPTLTAPKATTCDFPLSSTKEYLYDHPPSTGSYRAASMPEPPDINTSLTHEPLYDEIPSGMIPTPVTQPPPYKSASLYMNTLGKTRF